MSLHSFVVAYALSVAGLAWTARADDCEIFVGAGETKTLSQLTDADVVNLLEGGKGRTLVKTGGGRLVVEVDLASAGYTGKILISEGYFRIHNKGACGTSGGGVEVAVGATLECDCTGLGESNPDIAPDEPLTFGGFGADGSGCVKMVGGSTYRFFQGSKKTMTADSQWNAEAGYFEIRAGIFDMNGYRLNTVGLIGITGCDIVNPGNIVCGGSVNFEARTALNGDSSNMLTLDSGGESQVVQFRNLTYDKMDWTMAVSNDVTIEVRNSQQSARTNLASAVNYNRYKGPIYIGEGATLSANAATYVSGDYNEYLANGEDPYHHLVNLNGKISGPGGIRTLNAYGRYGYMRVMCPENDFSGGVRVDSGTILEAVSVGALGTGPITFGESGRLIFLNGSQWDTNALDSAELGRILGLKAKFYDGKPFGYSTSQISFPTIGDGTYGGLLDGTLNVFHHENNTLTLAGNITGSPMLYNGAGRLVIAGTGDNQVGRMFVADGAIEMAAGTKVFIGDNTYVVSGSYPNLPRLVVGENATLAARNVLDSALPTSFLGNGGLGPDGKWTKNANSRGILEIRDGAIVTNQFSMGDRTYSFSNTNDMGAVYLRGTLVQYGSNSRDALEVGRKSEGYLEVDGGFLDASKESEWIHVGHGRDSVPGYGVMHVKSGTVAHRSVGFGVNSGGGYGHLRVSGGLVTNYTLIVGKSLWEQPTGGEGVVTVEGSGVLNVDTHVDLGGISNSVSVLNLNGGRLEAKMILGITNQCITAGGDYYPLDYSNANNPRYVNFNGGTFRSTQSWSLRDWMSHNITRLTIFAGGATIDVGDYPREMTEDIKAPTGDGVKSIEFSCDEPWRYIGAPYVRIIDPSGKGYGASACADFDSGSGTITGVTVTSPGCDYGPDTFAEIRFGGWTNIVRAAVTLAPNAPGGDFAKAGAAKLSYLATNECSGTVRVLEGELHLDAPDIFPNAKGFHVAEGATLNRNNACGDPSGSLSGTGSVGCGYTIAGEFTVDAADIIAGRYLTCDGKVTIAPGTKLTVLHPELLAKDMRSMTILVANGGISGTLTVDASVFGASWCIAESNGRLRFGPVHGTVVTIR